LLLFLGGRLRPLHGIKGFGIPTKSFVKIGITKIFCYNHKMFGSINKTFGCCGKISLVVPNIVAVTKPFFSVCGVSVVEFGNR